MDAIADQPQGGTGNRTPRQLPRHVSDHLGQVLRNRLRDTLFMPFPGEMLRAIEALPKDLALQGGGSAPTDAVTEPTNGG
jgi:hypothetical protein